MCLLIFSSSVVCVMGKQVQDSEPDTGFEGIACFNLKLEGTQQNNFVLDICVMSHSYASSDIAKEFSCRDKSLQWVLVAYCMLPSFVKSLGKLSECCCVICAKVTSISDMFTAAARKKNKLTISLL